MNKQSEKNNFHKNLSYENEKTTRKNDFEYCMSHICIDNTCVSREELTSRSKKILILNFNICHTYGNIIIYCITWKIFSKILIFRSQDVDRIMIDC